MFKRRSSSKAPVSVTGVAYGLELTFEAPDPSTLELMRSALPPGWVENRSAATSMRVALTTEDGNVYRINLNDSPMTESALGELLDVLPGMVRQYVAGSAPEMVFVHAGAVAYNGRGIVFPGRSFAGKSTLTAALVRAGAEYYSDEYAVITPEGHLVPYAKDLSMRLTEGHSMQTSQPVSELGGTVGREPVKVGLLVLTQYRARTIWDPAELSVAQGVVEVLGHTEPVQDRPAQTVAAVTRALEGATVLQGHRGDADETAAALLTLLG